MIEDPEFIEKHPEIVEEILLMNDNSNVFGGMYNGKISSKKDIGSKRQ